MVDDYKQEMVEMKNSVYIGWDSREPEVYDVCAHSIGKHNTGHTNVMALKINDLREKGLYTRPDDPLSSTEFSFTRFLTPVIHKIMCSDGSGYGSRWALFCDSDILFTRDIKELFDLADNRYAVMCVQHDYKPTHTTKMDGKTQHLYPRKNWSSVILWNCAHPDNDVVTAEMVNSQTGQYLHRFSWLSDDVIGSLPEEWNWLEGWSKKPETGLPAAIHYTNGAPNFKECQNVDYAAEWLAAYQECK